MTYSKKDTEIILSLFHSFISDLSNKEYENLINGYAEIKVIDKEVSSTENYLEFIAELNKFSSVQDKHNYLKTNMGQKRELISLAKYLDIKVNSKMTINELIEKIISRSNEVKEEILYKLSKLTQEENEITLLYHQLEETMDTEIAKNLLRSSDQLKTKKDFIQFARRFDVFPDKNASIDNIIDIIVKSVVEAKLRSYKIRQKI